MKYAPIEERFARYVVRQDGCWGWIGQRNYQGYGRIKLSRQTRHGWAHRVSFEIHRGPIPVGMFVLHRCDNPPCTNPDHLFLGTKGDNMRDAVAKGRLGSRNGESNNAAKLTTIDVVDIRTLRSFGARRMDLAASYGVDVSQITRITERRKWRHVA